MARLLAPVQGASCQVVATLRVAASIRVIAPSAGSPTKMEPFPSVMAEPGRPERGMVAATWLVAVSMTVALWPRELKTKTDLETGSKTMALGTAPVRTEVTSLRLERSKT